ncbi:MAG TPA: mechanosensitive ion channel family protein [Herpetosiphonaceae bacterium]
MATIDWNAYWDRAAATAVAVLPRLLAVVAVLLLLRFAVRLAGGATTRLLRRVELAPEAESFIATLVRIIVIVAGLVVVLLIMGWGQLAASFVAGLGISGLVIGFALQDITKNFAAGLLLLFVRPFRVGDRIAVGADEGVVTELALRATTLRTADGRELLIPNANIYTGTITNLTRYAQRRHTVTLDLKPEAPLAEALPALLAAMRGIEPILEQPAADVLVASVELEKLRVEARFWLKSQGVDAQAIRSAVALRMRAVAHERKWL